MVFSQKRHLAPPQNCLLYTSPSPRDRGWSRMPSSAWKKKSLAKSLLRLNGFLLFTSKKAIFPRTNDKTIDKHKFPVDKIYLAFSLAHFCTTSNGFFTKTTSCTTSKAPNVQYLTVATMFFETMQFHELRTCWARARDVSSFLFAFALKPWKYWHFLSPNTKTIQKYKENKQNQSLMHRPKCTSKPSQIRFYKMQ